MKHESIRWKSKDGLDMYGQYWKTDGPEKAVLAIVHGFGEHSDRYEHVAAQFNEASYSVFSQDHRGHGRSGGQRGHTPSYDALMDDLEVMLEKIRDYFPGAPILFYGHSMGGNLVANYLIRRRPDVRGAVLTGPFFRTADPPPAFQLALGRVMNKFWGAFPDRAKLDPSHVSRDEEVVRKYVDDDLVHNKISARMGLALIAEGQAAIDKASGIELPVFIIHGGDDKLTSVDGSREFTANAGDNVSMEVLPDFYHEVHNDPGKEEVINKLIRACDGMMA